MPAIHPWPARFRPPHFSFPFFQSCGPGSLDLFVLLETYLRAQGLPLPCFGGEGQVFPLMLWVPDPARQPPEPAAERSWFSEGLVLGGAGASQVGSRTVTGTQWLVGTVCGPAPPGSALALPSCRKACYKHSLPC